MKGFDKYEYRETGMYGTVFVVFAAQNPIR